MIPLPSPVVRKARFIHTELFRFVTEERVRNRDIEARITKEKNARKTFGIAMNSVRNPRD